MTNQVVQYLQLKWRSSETKKKSRLPLGKLTQTQLLTFFALIEKKREKIGKSCLNDLKNF